MNVIQIALILVMVSCGNSQPDVITSGLPGSWRLSSLEDCQTISTQLIARTDFHMTQEGRQFPYTATTNVYNTGQCGFSPLFSLEFTGYILVLNERMIATELIREALHWRQEYRITPLSTVGTAFLNDTTTAGAQAEDGLRFCGKDMPWVLNTAFIATGSNCLGFDTTRHTSSPDILKLSTDRDRIAFGNGLLGQAEPFAELDDGTGRTWYRLRP